MTIRPIRISDTKSVIIATESPNGQATYAHPNVIEKIVDWKMGDPRWLSKHRRADAIARGAHMQRQFTMELRVDYADADKNEVMKTALKHAARHVFATASLLADNGIRPEIAVHSDDFFSGHEEIKMLDDVIAQGIEETSSVDAGEVSSELLSAAREAASGA